MIATPQLKLPEEKSWVASRCKAVALRRYYNSFAYDGRFRLDMRRATAAMQLHRATMEEPVSNWADMPVMRCEPYTPPQEHDSSCSTATDGYPPALPLREPNDFGTAATAVEGHHFSTTHRSGVQFHFKHNISSLIHLQYRKRVRLWVVA